MTIKLLVFPALATHGKFIVASDATGNILGIDGSFNNDVQTKYFSSEEQARSYVMSLPQECRSFEFIN